MTYTSPLRVVEAWLVRERIMGATVVHLSSLVTYLQVSVVDQLLV